MLKNRWLRWRKRTVRGTLAPVLLAISVALALLWASSFRVNFGIGVGAGSRAGAALVEGSTVTGGLLIVCDGTRTDGISYDGPTGYGQGPFESLYLLTIDNAGGPHLWRPRIEAPAPWCGPYIFVPLWMPILVFLGLGCAVAFMRRQPHGTCPMCRYPVTGLPPGAPCPECGLVRLASAEA
jgi:hypothetical protein